MSKGVSLCPSGSTGWQLVFGVGTNVPNTSRVLLESLAWGLWASQGLGVPLVPLGPWV